MAKFKVSLQADYAFVPDPEGAIIQAYGVKVPVFTLAQRKTFVIDGERRIVSVSSGGNAIDPTAALSAASGACAVSPPAASLS